MYINRRQFILASSAMAVAATAGAGPEKKYKACIIGDSKMGGYGHCIQCA